MELNQIKSIVEDNYELNIIDIEKIKNVYKIKSVEGNYCLKVIKYDLPHFLFIISVIKHLQNKGFRKIPKMYENKHGVDYVSFGRLHSYLTDWVEARECNYENPMDIAMTAKKLAELHTLSKGFTITNNMRPRIGWFKWINNFKTRRNEILDFKDRILKKASLTEFDELYLKNIEEELERCDNATVDLINSEYLMKMNSHMTKREFCHHDLAHHNILMEKNGDVSFIDFDYAILDTHLHDLSSLLIRRMKNGKWEIDNALFVLDAYNSIYKIDQSDIGIMAGFIEFPQDYWQVGIQYYWERQPWGEEFFLKKLNRIYEDKDEKHDFVDEFSCLKYKG